MKFSVVGENAGDALGVDWPAHILRREHQLADRVHQIEDFEVLWPAKHKLERAGHRILDREVDFHVAVPFKEQVARWRAAAVLASFCSQDPNHVGDIRPPRSIKLNKGPAGRPCTRKVQRQRTGATHMVYSFALST